MAGKCDVCLHLRSATTPRGSVWHPSRTVILDPIGALPVGFPGLGTLLVGRVCLRFSSLVEETAADTVVIDVEGCALLFGSAYEFANEHVGYESGRTLEDETGVANVIVTPRLFDK